MRFIGKLLSIIGAVALVGTIPIDISYARSGESTSNSSSKSSSGYSKPSSSPTISKPTPAPAKPASVTPSKQTAPVKTEPVTKPSAVKPTETKPPPVKSESKSQSGYTKPAIGTTAGAAALGGGAAIASQPADTQKKSEVQAKDPLAEANKKAISANSLKALQAERAQAQKPPQPIKKEEVKSNPVFNSTSKQYAGNPNRYVEQRNITYNIYRTQHPDMFSYNRGMAPNYGIYDSNFLTGMIIGAIGNNLISNAMWLSAQQHQPWYPAYRADLERQAQDNLELRTKLAIMDAEIAKIKSDKTPSKIDEVNKAATTLPSGIDASVAISPEAIMAAESESNSGIGVIGIILIVVGVGIGASVVTYLIIKK